MSFVHFLAFSHLKKRRAISLLFFFLFSWGCANDFTKRELKYVFSPFPSRMNFLEMSRLVLCVLISLFIFLFALFMIVKLDSIKTFLYKGSFAASELKTFRKARDPASKKKSIFGSESLKSRLELVLPTAFKEMLTAPHGKDNLKLTQTKVRVLLFEAFICMA